MKELFQCFIMILLTFNSSCAFTSFLTCTGVGKYYDYTNQTCLTCPTNTVQTPSQIYCNCSVSTGYYPNTAAIGFSSSTSCQKLTTALPSLANQVIAIYNNLGAKAATTLSCNAMAIPSQSQFRCIPCTQNNNMNYDTDLGICMCTTSGQYPINGVCYAQKTAFIPVFTKTANAQKYIAYFQANVGCLQYNLPQPCSKLLNICAKAQFVQTDQFCTLLTKNINGNIPNLPLYKFSSAPSESLGIYASSIPNVNLTDVKNKLDFVLFQYNLDGSVNDIKPIDDSIMPCSINDEDLVRFQSFGLNLYKTCAQITVKTGQYFYDLYVKTSQGKYMEVPFNFRNQYYKRFTPYSTIGSVRLQLISAPPLQTPILTFTDASSGQIQNISTATNTNINYIVPLAIILALSIIIYIYNFFKYIRYNPDAQNDQYYCFKLIFVFVLMGLRYISMGMWIFLFVLSVYVFGFYKFQQTIYLILPDIDSQWKQLYEPFMIIFYIQTAFTFFGLIHFIFDISTTTDYFLIDWEKEKHVGNLQTKFKIGQNQPGVRNNKKQISVWRKVLLVNELYELTIKRLVNIEFIILFSMLFLEGLSWIDQAYQVPSINSNLLSVSSSSKQYNPVLAFGIISFVIFALALCQYIFRIAMRIWFPLPYENFVDLCSISNISLVIFDENLHGYYIHGMNPIGQAEGSLQYIESVFEKQSKSFGKSRAFKVEDPDQCQTFEVIFPFELRQNFQIKYKSKYLQKLVANTMNTSVLSRPIPQKLPQEDYQYIEQLHYQMLQSFKFYLQGIKTSQFNVQQRSLWQKLLSWPVDVSTIGRLPIFFKDKWFQFTNVLLMGHEFLFIINVINSVFIFFIATKSVMLATFITMIIYRVFVKNATEFMLKRNIARNTMIDDKFFN